MNTIAQQRTDSARTGHQVVYKTVCENPGCGFAFDLNITRANIGLLGQSLACPQCRRPGGALKRDRQLGKRVFSSRLQFREGHMRN